MEDNPIIKYLRDNWNGLYTFLAGIALALAPLLGKALIDHMTGKAKDESDTSAANVANSLIGAAQNMADLSAQLMQESEALQKIKLKELETKYKLLESEMKVALHKLEQQNTKLKEQLERVRSEAAQLRREAETWRNQLIKLGETPEAVPLLFGDKK